MPINPDKVNVIFIDCLSRKGEDASCTVTVEGIRSTVGFHPERLKRWEETIITLLEELPDDFRQSRGGGMSFLNACNDRHGNQWTGFHLRMEQLFQLGIAIGRVKCLLPREMWRVLPGGMPYYYITDSKIT